MGAITVTMDTSCTHNVDGERMMTGKLTLSSNYAPGGDSWTAPQFGLGLIHDLKVESGALLPVALITAESSGTIKVYVAGNVSGAINEEIAAGTNLSGYSYRFQAWGW